MKNFFKDLLIIAAAAVLCFFLFLFLGHKKPLHLQFSSSEYTFDSNLKTEGDYSNFKFSARNIAAGGLPAESYTEAVTLPKKALLTISCDVQLLDAASYETNAVAVYFSTTEEMFQDSGDYIEFPAFRRGFKVISGNASALNCVDHFRDREFSVLDRVELHPGDVFHLTMNVEKTGNKFHISIHDDKNDKDREYELKLYGRWPNASFLRVGGTNCIIQNVEIENSYQLRVSSNGMSKLYAGAFFLSLIVVYMIIYGLCQTLNQINDDEAFSVLRVSASAFPLTLAIVIASQFITDRLVRTINSFISQSLALKVFSSRGFSLPLPHIGTVMFWICLVVATAIGVFFLIYLMSDSYRLSGIKMFLGWLVLGVLADYYIVGWLVVLVSVFNAVAPLAIVLAIIFLLSGFAGATPQYSGKYAKELSEYDSKLKSRERVFNMIVDGAAFTAEEKEAYGLATKDVGIINEASLQRDYHNKKMEEFEQMLQERDSKKE